jgi:tRNA modification GTPase
MSFDLQRKDTVCAVATSPGKSAIAIVRVSGPRADAVREVVFRPRRGAQRAFVVTRGDVVDARGVIDDALCTSFPAGKSYTGEPSFELSLHGSPVAVKATLAALLAAGCRPAEPGELTLRAHLSGRMTLAEAEAVEDVIDARTDAALRAAQRALHGAVGSAVEAPRSCIVDVLAELEARLDFPDEDLGEARGEALARALEEAEASLRALVLGAARADRLRRGARVVLFGAPNAGKSTLLNALAGEERALVHDEPGTTRDVIEVALEIDDVEVTLVDVAGVRDAAMAGAVERAGIARARAEAERADLVLVVEAADAPVPVSVHTQAPVVRVSTKADLAASAPGALAVCAPRGDGLAALRAAISLHVTGGGAAHTDVLLLRERQVRAVADAADAVARARAALTSRVPHEMIASELRLGVGALDRLLGKDVSVDVLDAIFTRFCIGK